MPVLNITVKITHKQLKEVLNSLGFERSEKTVTITHGVKKGKTVNDNRSQKITVYKHKRSKHDLIMTYSPLNRLVSDSDYNSVKRHVYYNSILDQEKLDKLFLKL